MLDQQTKGSTQPSARLMAQMRVATSKAGLPSELADMMSEVGIPASRADQAASALAEARKAIKPLMNSERVTADDLTRISEKALRAGMEADKPEDMADEIRKVAAEAAMEIAAASEDIIYRHASDYLTETGGTPAQARAGAAVTLADRMADGLLARMQPGHTPTMGREFARMRLDDLAAYSAASNASGRFGNRPTMGGLHTSGDFAYALGIASNKVLLNAYEMSESQIKLASREVDAPDFRPINTVRVTTGMELDKVNEAGEFTSGTIKDAGEAFALETYGKIFALTRQALVNDDLGALTNAARIQGTGAALTEARLFASLLEKNGGLGPTMADGKTLFHADHGNLAGTGGLLSVATLGAARVALRRQKGLSGEAMQIQPALLVVPPELETDAQRIVATITAAAIDQVNPFSDKLEVLVDANLTSETAWYLVAAPGVPDGLLHAYLDGAKGPQVFTREGFEVDSFEFKTRLDFGCGFVDHRAWYRNAGYEDV